MLYTRFKLALFTVKLIKLRFYQFIFILLKNLQNKSCFCIYLYIYFLVGLVQSNIFIGVGTSVTLVALFGSLFAIMCVIRKRKNAIEKQSKTNINTRATPRRGNRRLHRSDAYEETIFQTATRDAAREHYASMIADPYTYKDLWLSGDIYLHHRHESSQPNVYIPSSINLRKSSYDTRSEPTGRTMELDSAFSFGKDTASRRFQSQNPPRAHCDHGNLEAQYLKIIPTHDEPITRLKSPLAASR